MSAVACFLRRLALGLFYPLPAAALKSSGRTGTGAEVSSTLYTATLQGKLSGDKGSLCSALTAGLWASRGPSADPGFPRLLLAVWTRADLEGSANTQLPRRRGRITGGAQSSP